MLNDKSSGNQRERKMASKADCSIDRRNHFRQPWRLQLDTFIKISPRLSSKWFFESGRLEVRTNHYFFCKNKWQNISEKRFLHLSINWQCYSLKPIVSTSVKIQHRKILPLCRLTSRWEPSFFRKKCWRKSEKTIRFFEKRKKEKHHKTITINMSRRFYVKTMKTCFFA